MSKFEYIINRIASRHGVHSLFSDLLDLLIYAFSAGRKEKEYYELIHKYEKPEAYTISEAMAALIIEMTGDGNGMVDVLGHYYQQNIYRNNTKQFFQPQNLCDEKARMQNSANPVECITDPFCGSGRMLMAMSKVNRFVKFYGIEKYGICAKIAVINLCLNKMYCEITWMNSLTNDFYAAWEIFPTVKGVPCIRQISEKESYIHLKLPEKNKETKVASARTINF
jgi:type I restriction-modification system DNA methylase subunit